MKKTILTFGLVIGLLLTIHAIYMVNKIYADPNFQGNDIIGYTKLIVMFSLIYFGVRNYRDNYLDGKINFLQALKKGALICLIASTVYTVLCLIYYYVFTPDWLEVFTEHVIRNSPADQVEAVTAQMTQFKEWYKNPFFAILITYMEVLPIGMVVALVSAIFVRKK